MLMLKLLVNDHLADCGSESSYMPLLGSGFDFYEILTKGT